jgi:hypothetical protein
MHGHPEGRLGHGLAARSSHGGDPCGYVVAHAGAWSPHAARARDGAVAKGPVVASRQQGVADELVGTTGRAPGNRRGGKDH